MTIDFKMPKLGESVTEGTIGRWLKSPGDRVEQYEPMLEVTTDKVDTEVSAPVDGILAAILVGEGETVGVGTVIARLEPAGDAAGNGAAPAALQQQAETVTPAGAASSSFVSPAVARLAAQHGLEIAAIPGTGAGGRVTKRDVEAFAARRHEAPPATAEMPEQALPDGPEEPQAPVELPASPATLLGQRAVELPASPATLLGQRAVEQAQLQQAFEVGTHGDQEPAVPAASSSARRPSPAVPASPSSVLQADVDLLPLSPIRRAIAEHMLRSKQTSPHVTTVMEADLSRVVAHRDRNRADWERQGVKLSFTPYFVQAAVAALGEVPQLNSSWSDTGILLHRRINIGVAVALDDGLLVPVVKDADDKSLLGIARAVADLAERARTRRLSPDDTREGTFTVTNHGVWGSLFATPVINQPQAGILGVGAIQKRVVVIGENGQDSFAIRPMCYLSLTFDHRIADGATADRFLAAVKRALEAYDS